MKYKKLGNTELKVSELCFGTLPMSPLQYNIDIADGAELIREAIELGFNFIDSAQNYRTYPYLKEALKDCKNNIIISTKSKSPTFEGMNDAVEEALIELDREYIDLFFIHGDKAGKDVFTERSGALESLMKHKKRGTIRYIGLSTHSVKAVEAAARNDDIDVIFPLINIDGFGILDGNRDEMLNVIMAAEKNGKGIIAMKVFGGGTLLKSREKAFEYIKNQPFIHSMAIGMINKKELEFNVALYSNGIISEELKRDTLRTKKLIITGLCIGCGQCTMVCPTGAMRLVGEKAEADPEKCLLCGYCSSNCKQLAIRII